MTNEEEEEACLSAMRLASASVLPRVLKLAIELDLLELIKKSGTGAYVSPSELAAQLPTQNLEAPVMLDRILRLLACYSVLNCTLKDLPDGGVESLYGLAPVCKFFTKNEDGVSMAALLLMNQDKVLMESWKSIYKAYGMSAFEYHGKDPRFNKVFNQGMSNHSTIIMKKILEIYQGFQGLKTVVDVGGGTGATLNMIVSKYLIIKGVDHIGGPKGDAIFFKVHYYYYFTSLSLLFVPVNGFFLLALDCHDWSDEDRLKLLKNCHEALPENGKVILAECLVDVIMLAYNPGGKEGTENEFEALAKAADFRGFTKVCCPYNTWIMEFLK
ncbi:hypothetical protein M9H77_36816 [Catharanthus roseus]|uniref:Uncharacterized protein n=1 Tax=Catharanthus roseus TaxID=4058 RepID=A0ACB9ZSV1_CATRO|nr:hypothetical protein M9H77_36816 [Catharanthus roseus]